MNRQTVLVGCLVTLLFALLWERRADVWSLINTTPAYAQTGVATPNLSPEAAVGTGFTYQGQLTSGGTTVNDTCDFEFKLFDAASGGTQQGSTLTSSGVGVANGLFTVSLDFGAGHFLGQARWLEAAVRCPVGSGGFTTLSPRQALSPTPNALFAAGAGTLVHPGFTMFAPDTATDTGLFPSVAIGRDGLPLIAYRKITGSDLQVAHCHDMACSTATVTTLVSANLINGIPNIAIGSDGLGIISYYDDTNDDLRVAHCSNVACTEMTTALVDALNNVGLQSAIAIGTDGFPLIAYIDSTGGNLKVAHCQNVLCTASSTATVDNSADFVGSNPSVVIGSDGLGLISYANSTTRDLEVAHCSNTACSAATISSHDTANVVGFNSSITIGTDGLGIISYQNDGSGDLKVAHCSNFNCTTSTVTTLFSTGEVGFSTSITMGPDGYAIIAYQDATNGDLRVTRCALVLCNSFTHAIPDASGNIGQGTDITIGADGLPLIVYYDDTNGDLRVIHCADLFCHPHASRP
ncbi:MAG: hypothetical protein OT477_14055 [Chloroflexi bacterium]|nr:hypothetical protein [Chloroflexota bacterium]